ncbi:CTP--molybdopterin cytidylyltransferase [Maritimibacter sp. 55A14]|uniref:nucleotidyltransferase family protein n=1 Tax=Maritimibacter sp. 55A14 TaxID=2174844 RepID=UPI000D60FE7D|nr:nucleotidyltransferase family protein [Maritimibacter sp. 55A14]PWE34188.1 CTP--molybdopterin cytidylyltransferase [Maritimibacter sp. 55A14]
MSQTAILLLAAGASRRMRGRDKLLEPMGDRPLLRERAETCLRAGAGLTVAVLPPDTPARQSALDGLEIRIVVARDAGLGMAASIRAGIRALPPQVEAALLVLADMPELTSADLAAVLNAHDPTKPRICRGTAEDGRPGHPVLFPARLFPRLLELDGDEGARSLIEAERGNTRAVPLPGRRALTDLDTPEDWARWRKHHTL